MAQIPMMNSVDVRKKLIEALRLDLIGPDNGSELEAEVLPQMPSRWYLTGFLVPTDAIGKQKIDETSGDDFEAGSEPGGTDDNPTGDRSSGRQSPLPSSIGLSLLLHEATRELNVTVRWGDYTNRKHFEGHGSPEEWERKPCNQELKLTIPAQTKKPIEKEIPGSQGLQLASVVRPVTTDGREGYLPLGTRNVSLFVVNKRHPQGDEVADLAFAFQVELEVTCAEGFVARPNLRGLVSDDWDERVADLQYRHANEYAVGHNIATEAVVENGSCHRVRTCWIPQAQVERVAPAPLEGIELSMDVLSELKDGAAVLTGLGKFVEGYQKWIIEQDKQAPTTPAIRAETARELLQRAEVACRRIEDGIALLADPQCLEAFRLANKVMAAAGRQRLGLMVGKDPRAIRPSWRPFQLAFILMNLRGIAEPGHHDRGVVDLLFFPTGGGKTEAYLGLAAFTLVLRRLRNPNIASAGLSVLMRYTLRLLTLDQLGRAATLICALELERQNDTSRLGDWPFEIGLWVGQAATPNRMGFKGDNDPYSARSKTIAKKDGSHKPSPIPLENCPWCGKPFTPVSFVLLPNSDNPTNLRVVCADMHCKFTRNNPLPILAVDEPIYRRIPCFLIATVDKFAAMPWTGEVGAFFGRVQRYDKEGFYGPCQPNRGKPLPVDRLPPPDLVIQDELHLISGPLGTMAGLYETALDYLASVEVNQLKVGPKIVASTATVRRAEKQIRSIFNRRQVDIFPPPGPDLRDSFFARTLSVEESNARHYLGIAAQGRSPKVIMLRVYLVLLATAQKWYSRLGTRKDSLNPADPYMTLLGYFNSLRELGGARRLIEDEILTRLGGYATRKRLGETEGLFDNRKIDYEPVELTSRVNTAEVSRAKQRLALPFGSQDDVDVAIATNMISVGLDITRLGLMVVFNQPKTSAEYIQATSRVGRDHDRPGLVVTILNVHKARDRSHYERFAAYHESFYRSVEATSVTPFSPRALDRGLAGAVVALARQGHSPMTSARGASEILRERGRLDFVVKELMERSLECCGMDRNSEEAHQISQRVRDRAQELLDDWSKLADQYSRNGVALQYQKEEGAAQPLLAHFLDAELKNLPPHHPRMKFRANRSLRDVEATVKLWLKKLDGSAIEDLES